MENVKKLENLTQLKMTGHIKLEMVKGGICGRGLVAIFALVKKKVNEAADEVLKP